MAKLTPIGVLKWKPSPTTDVVGYRVFWEGMGETPADAVAKDVSYTSNSVDVSTPPAPGEKLWSTTLPVEGMSSSSFGPNINAFKVGIAALDKAGNLSDIIQIAVDARSYKVIADATPPDEIVDPEYYVYQ